MSKSQLRNNTPSRQSNSANTPRTIKGRVYSVILDEDHFFFRDVLKNFDSSYIGWIYWGNLNLKQGGLTKPEIIKYCTLAKPYFGFLTYHPLNTEVVELIKGPSNKHYPALGGNATNAEYFYFPPLNVWNNSAGNPLPSESDIQRSEGELPLGNYTGEDKIAGTTNRLPFEGDMILEGRFGNSIRFGSSNPRGKNNWSENDSEGDPITIISNGQPSKDSTPLEDINNDASSIYLTSNQNIQNFNIASKNFKSLNANFTEAPSGLEPIQAFIQNPIPTAELLNGPSLNQTQNLNSPIVEGQSNQITFDDEGSEDLDKTLVSGGGYEDLVKIPGVYKDNRNRDNEIYLLPKEFSKGTILVTAQLAAPLMKMLLAAKKEGVIVKVNSGFRPPIDDVYLNNELIQVSQKTLRIKNLKDPYKGKIKEPWLKTTTCIEAFDEYKVGDTVTEFNGKKYFHPATAPSYASNHGASLACDFYTNEGTTEGYKWVCKHGWKYGFIRTVSSECWHFDYKPNLAQKGATHKLEYKYEPGKPILSTTNSWNNVFGPNEPNWAEEWTKFQNQQAQELNESST